VRLVIEGTIANNGQSYCTLQQLFTEGRLSRRDSQSAGIP